MGVPFSTAAATRAMVSPARQRQPSAVAQTDSKLSARLAKPGRHSSEWGGLHDVPSSWDEAVSHVENTEFRAKFSRPVLDGV